MANEIRLSQQAVISKGTFRDGWAPGSVAFDLSAAGGGNPGSVDIGTAEEDIAFGDITPGVIFFQNIGVNNVQIGPKSGGAMIPCMLLLPGKTQHFYLDTGVILRAKAATATTRVTIKGYPA